MQDEKQREGEDNMSIQNEIFDIGTIMARLEIALKNGKRTCRKYSRQLIFAKSAQHAIGEKGQFPNSTAVHDASKHT